MNKIVSIYKKKDSGQTIIFNRIISYKVEFNLKNNDCSSLCPSIFKSFDIYIKKIYIKMEWARVKRSKPLFN